jgi:predicted GNAT family N-acyltransferase
MTAALAADGPDRRDERIGVVRSLDDFLRVAAIRSVVYIGDQKCPFDEEFDGNDFCGMHLLGWIGDEPVACLRIRFFNGFAKVERLAVLPEHRQSSIAFRIVRHALRLIARKGYRQAYGHAQEGLELFWMRFEARAIGPPQGFSFSGHRYTEMVVDLPAAHDAVRIGDDPLKLIRPEGAWDAPGILERSRGVDTRRPSTSEGRSSGIAPWPATVDAAWQAWRQVRPA